MMTMNPTTTMRRGPGGSSGSSGRGGGSGRQRPYRAMMQSPRTMPPLLLLLVLLSLSSPPNTHFGYHRPSTAVLAAAADVVPQTENDDGINNNKNDGDDSEDESYVDEEEEDEMAVEEEAVTEDAPIKNNGESSSSTTPKKKRARRPTYDDDDPSLNSESVVLITGAAGFIGSELALALLRTYDVKKLLLVDDLGIPNENERAFLYGKSKGGVGTIYEVMSEEDMGGFEMKRQRAFRIFHELTSSSRRNGDGRGGGTNDDEGYAHDIGDAETVRFYRADMRPSIPEFFDFGEVPLLEGIFQGHPDITHVVHLADVPLHAQNQAIPRNKDSVKTGRMEGLLEEMRLMIDRANDNDDDDNDRVRLPQFVYASSHEVYDRISSAPGHRAGPNPPPFREDLPITTPSSLHGTAKLIDEVLASAYHSTHGIYSVGLRFFNVYGPWNAPGTVVFDLAERVLAANKNNYEPAMGGGVDDEDEGGGSDLGGGLYHHHEEDVNDYVYIDDAVDAILGAMQYRPPATDGPPPPVVFNVGTGRGTVLRELKAELSRHFPKSIVGGGGAAASDEKKMQQRLPTKSVASPTLSTSLLGFEARIPLEEGLAHTLTWHRDRVFPYGRSPDFVESFEVRGIENKIAKSLATSRRRASTGEEMDEEGGECSPLDRECLRDAMVFPCASECRRLDRCTPSAWDEISQLSKMVTTGCDAVLYTVLLDDDAEQIPSAIVATSTDFLPFVGAGLPDDVGGRTQARCNVAFVSSKSPLVKRLKSEGEEYLDGDDAGGGDGSVLPPLLRHGFWTVLPVPTPSSSDTNSSWLHAFDGTFALEYLPKVSPGRFFGSSVRYAVYAAPTVLVKNLSNVLKRMENGPAVPPVLSEGRSSSRTALIVALRRPSCDAAQRGAPCTNSYTRPPNNDLIQSHAYNMVRMALRGDLLGGGLDPVLDSSLVVHSLREEESRLFRCDVYGEAAQWGASSDERALEFIISLHDLWSRAFVHWSTGSKPWWIDAAGGAPADATEGAGKENEEGDQQQQQRRRSLLENSSSGVVEQRGKWMGILSQMDPRLFTHIIHSEDLGVIHLD